MPSARQEAEPKRPQAEAAEAPGKSPSLRSPTAQSPNARLPRPRAAKAQPGRLSGGAGRAQACRRLAREIGVNIDEVQGTGPDGRISEEDVKEHARRILSSMRHRRPRRPRRGSAARPAVPLPDFERWGADRAAADEQHPADDRGAPQPRVEHDSARHAVRQGRHHRDGGAAAEISGTGPAGWRQPHRDGDAGQGDCRWR